MEGADGLVVKRSVGIDDHGSLLGAQVTLFSPAPSRSLKQATYLDLEERVAGRVPRDRGSLARLA